jgi:hypothetical protein
MIAYGPMRCGTASPMWMHSPPECERMFVMQVQYSIGDDSATTTIRVYIRV